MKLHCYVFLCLLLVSGVWGQSCQTPRLDQDIVLYKGVADLLKPCYADTQKVQNTTGEIRLQYKEVHEKIEDLNDDVEKLRDNFIVFRNAAGKVLKFAKRIPKIGKVFGTLNDKVLPKVEDFVVKVQNRVEKAYNISKKIDSNLDRAHKVAKAGEVTIGLSYQHAKLNGEARSSAKSCVTKTSECTDDNNAESLFQKPLYRVTQYDLQLKFCNKVSEVKQSLSDVKKYLLDELQKAINAIIQAFDPFVREMNKIFNEINKIMKEIEAAFSEAMCCYNPKFIDYTLQAAAKLADTVTCPMSKLEEEMFNQLMALFDPLIAVIDAPLQTAVDKALAPINKLAQIMVPEPIYVSYMSLPGFCGKSLSVPSFRLVSSPLISKIEYDVFGERTKKPDIQNFILEMALDCAKSVMAFGEWDNSNCCRLYKPLKNDGEVCDPTATVPASACTMCKWGYEHWYTKAFTACGYEPKYPDGKSCALFTSCDRCKNTATYWYKPKDVFFPMTACGKEPGWSSGTICVPYISCHNCRYSGQYFWDIILAKCK